MVSFSKKEIKEMKSYLFESSFHDATIYNIEFQILDGKYRNLRMVLYNRYTNVKIDIIFEDVLLYYSVMPTMQENDTTVMWFGIAEKDTILTNFLSEYDFECEDMLYLGFQVLFQNEIKLLCRKVYIEESKTV